MPRMTTVLYRAEGNHPGVGARIAALACCFVVAWLAAGCGAEVAEPVVLDAGDGYTIEYAEDDCPFEVRPGADITCGFLTVPEDRRDPDGLTVELAVAVVHSLSADPAPDPVLYLEGGPGGSALAYPDDWLTSPILETRDIILFDQRGTGYSWPSLDCAETDAYDAGEYGDYDTRLDAVEACRQRLRDEGIDLAQYNSAASAADVNDLRLAMGIDAWNLYGISYGTRLALTVLRDFPEGVRSVVIDSVYPPNVNGYVEDAQNSIDAILALLDGCAADADCDAAFPDLTARFLDALAALEAEPLLVDEEGYLLEDASADDEYAYTYAGIDVVNTLVDLLYDTAAISGLPLAIDGLASGDIDRWFEVTEGDWSTYTENDDELLGDELSYDEETEAFLEELSDSQGMFYSVECNEEAVFGTLDDAAALVADDPALLAELMLDELGEFYDACAVWPAGRAAAREADAVASAVPTLITSGEYDPVTPPHWGDLAGATLAESSHVVLPRGGHGVSVENECMRGIVVAFLEEPTAVPDTTCVAENVLPFVLALE